ncbi:MAG: efflux RND transporter permease subunit [Bacteroidia bacterium]|nr:efflux RND transporter permease subunit [Bacteroidia bacterium]
MTSTSRENAGSVTVEVLSGYDADFILQDVKNAVDQISAFPNQMEPPVIYKQESINFAISFALTGVEDLKTLKQFARNAEDQLRGVEGISKVQLSGFPEEEIEIAFRENALRAYNLTFEQAANKVRQANVEITGGTIETDEEEILIRADYKRYYADEIRNIVILTTNDGSIIRLRDIADVSDQWADDPQRSWYDGKPAAVVTVNSTSEEDILEITDYIQNFIQDFNESHGKIQANLIQNQSQVLQERINLLIENGLIGVGLVLILLSLFLNLHLAFWVADGDSHFFYGHVCSRLPLRNDD